MCPLYGKETKCYYTLGVPVDFGYGAPSWGMNIFSLHNFLIYLRRRRYYLTSSASFLFFLSLSASYLTSNVKAIFVSMANWCEFCVDVHERPSFWHVRTGFSEPRRVSRDHCCRRRHFRLPHLLPHPQGGLSMASNTMPDMNSTINDAEQDWFHLPSRVVGSDLDFSLRVPPESWDGREWDWAGCLSFFRWSAVFRWFSLFVDAVTLSLGLWREV